MTSIMNWKKCEQEFIRKVFPDKEKVKSLIEIAESRLKFVKSFEITKETASFVIENYYEIIKELLTALLLKNGLRSKNHQCLISYFYKEHPDYEFEANLIQQMSFLRNRLEYYGELIDKSFLDKNQAEIEKLIKLLNSLV